MKTLTSHDLVRQWQLARYGYINEAEENEEEGNEESNDDSKSKSERPHEEAPEDSLDNQIDAYLVKYEKDALGESLDPWVDWSSRAVSVLREEEVADRGNVDPEDDEEFNIDIFAQKVARLMNNYDSLLDIPGALRDRAMNYLEQYYGKNVADEFLEILDNQHDISFDDKDEYPLQGPPAQGAGPGGAGG